MTLVSSLVQTALMDPYPHLALRGSTRSLGWPRLGLHTVRRTSEAHPAKHNKLVTAQLSFNHSNTSYTRISDNVRGFLPFSAITPRSIDNVLPMLQCTMDREHARPRVLQMGTDRAASHGRASTRWVPYQERHVLHHCHHSLKERETIHLLHGRHLHQDIYPSSSHI